MFGVEFKFGDAKGGYRDDVATIRQAVDYSYCEFDRHGRLGIFLCPSPVLGYLRSAQDVITRYANRAAEESTIEYHRKRASSIWRATGHVFTDAELDAEARTRQWQAKKRQQAIEAGARAEGFRSAANREQDRLLGQAGFLVRMIDGRLRCW